MIYFMMRQVTVRKHRAVAAAAAALTLVMLLALEYIVMLENSSQTHPQASQYIPIQAATLAIIL